MPTINFRTRRTARALDRQAPTAAAQPLVDLRVRSRGIQGLGNALARAGGRLEADSRRFEREDRRARAQTAANEQALREREEGIVRQQGDIQLKNAQPHYAKSYNDAFVDIGEVTDDQILQDGFIDQFVEDRVLQFEGDARELSEESKFNPVAQESYNNAFGVSAQAGEIQLREALADRLRVAQRGVALDELEALPLIANRIPGDTIEQKFSTYQGLVENAFAFEGVENLFTRDEIRSETRRAEARGLDNLVDSGLQSDDPVIAEFTARQVLGTADEPSEVEYTDKHRRKAAAAEKNRVMGRVANAYIGNLVDQAVDEGNDPQKVKGDLIDLSNEVASDSEHYNKVLNPSERTSLIKSVRDQARVVDNATKNEAVYRDTLDGKRRSHGPASPNDVRAEAYGFDKLLRGPLSPGQPPEVKVTALAAHTAAFGFIGTKTQDYLGSLINSDQDDQEVALRFIEELDDFSKRTGLPGIRVAELKTEPQTGGVNVQIRTIDAISAMDPSMQTFAQNARLFMRQGIPVREAMRRAQQMKDADEGLTEPQREQQIQALIDKDEYKAETYLQSDEGSQVFESSDLGGITANQLADRVEFQTDYEARRESALRNGMGGAASAKHAAEVTLREWGKSNVGAMQASSEATYLPMEKVYKADSRTLELDIATTFTSALGEGHGEILRNLTPRPDIRADGITVFYFQKPDQTFVLDPETGEALAYQYSPANTAGIHSWLTPELGPDGKAVLDEDGIPVIKHSHLRPEDVASVNEAFNDFAADVVDRGLESRVNLPKIRKKVMGIVNNNMATFRDDFPGGFALDEPEGPPIDRVTMSKVYAERVLEEERDARNMWNAGDGIFGFVSDPIDFTTEMFSRMALGVEGEALGDVPVREAAVPLLQESFLEDTGPGQFLQRFLHPAARRHFRAPRTRADAEKMRREAR